MLPPYLQCQSGHLVCGNCRPKLQCCPTCRGPTRMSRPSASKVCSKCPQPGPREDREHGQVSMQVQQLWLPSVFPSLREGGARGAVRVQVCPPPMESLQTIQLSVPRSIMQMARSPERCDDTSGLSPCFPAMSADESAQVDHHSPRRRHCLPGDGHQPAGGRGLGDDAVLLRLPLHARPREAGKVRPWAADFLRRRSTDRREDGGRELHVQVRVCPLVNVSADWSCPHIAAVSAGRPLHAASTREWRMPSRSPTASPSTHPRHNCSPRTAIWAST